MSLKVESFEFSSYSINAERTEVSLLYTIHFEQGEPLHFTEKVLFTPEGQRSNASEKVIDRMVHSLHIISGINYWKLYCPKKIIISTRPLSKEMAMFWNEVYLKGLGEFYYRNNLPLSTAPEFPFEDVQYEPDSVQSTDRSLLGIGGGKDSIVAYEQLKSKNHDVTGLVIETQKSHSVIENVLSAMGLSAIRVKRLLDPQLFHQNSLDYTYNGHIPVSAVFACIGILTAYLYDYTYFIVGNEQSANSENVMLDGIVINHQWSKSIEFEKAFQQYISRFIVSGMSYFSLLRPHYEIKIVEKFSQYEKYFSVFSSCNRNFRISSDVNSKLWCGKCAKCAFIFSLFAAFLPKDKVIRIFGSNLYADESLSKIYRELLGIEGVKPFDCVGTKEEVRVAMNMALKRGEFQEDFIMKMFQKESKSWMNELSKWEKEVMNTHDTSHIPEEFKNSI